MNTQPRQIATIEGDVYRAAYIARAESDSLRPYLEHLFLSERGDLVGTNGHLMYVGPATHLLVEPRELLFAAPKAPALVTVVELWEHENPWMVTVKFIYARREDQPQIVAVSKQVYPDYQSILDMNRKRAPFYEYGFDTVYLRKLVDIFGKASHLKFDQANSGMGAFVTNIHRQGGRNLPGVAVIMPIRTV